MFERCIVAPEWKLILNTERSPELFNRERDPQETDNLGSSTSWARVRSELVERLRRWSWEHEDGQGLLTVCAPVRARLDADRLTNTGDISRAVTRLSRRGQCRGLKKEGDRIVRRQNPGAGLPAGTRSAIDLQASTGRDCRGRCREHAMKYRAVATAVLLMPSVGLIGAAGGTVIRD